MSYNDKEIKPYCKKKAKPKARKNIKWRKCTCLNYCKEKLKEIANNQNDPSLN